MYCTYRSVCITENLAQHLQQSLTSINNFWIQYRISFTLEYHKSNKMAHRYTWDTSESATGPATQFYRVWTPLPLAVPDRRTVLGFWVTRRLFVSLWVCSAGAEVWGKYEKVCPASVLNAEATSGWRGTSLVGDWLNMIHNKYDGVGHKTWPAWHALRSDVAGMMCKELVFVLFKQDFPTGVELSDWVRTDVSWCAHHYSQ